MLVDQEMRAARQDDRAPRHARKRLALLFTAVALVIVAIVVLAVVRSGPVNGTNGAVPAAVPEAPVAVAPDSLQDSIQSVLDENSDYRIGLAMADISGDAALTFGDQEAFTAASTAKIITAAAYYHLVETRGGGPGRPAGGLRCSVPARSHGQ
jgi:beta-lactamase class A